MKEEEKRKSLQKTLEILKKGFNPSIEVPEGSKTKLVELVTAIHNSAFESGYKVCSLEDGAVVQKIIEEKERYADERYKQGFDDCYTKAESFFEESPINKELQEQFYNYIYNNGENNKN